MPTPLIAGLPPECVLSAGYVIRLTALDPTTGAVVTGVTLTDVSILVSQLTGPNVEDGTPVPLLVPSQVI